MRMYCIFSREAIKAMNGNRGKMAAQAGHAYLHAYWDAEDRAYELSSKLLYQEEADNYNPTGIYRASGRATKVCLIVETTDELKVLHDAYQSVCGVSLVTDAGLTCFDGPTTTCLGIGPIGDDSIGDDIKQLKVLI